ncbi:MAG: NitT/TauT family transport system substrate-binding protein [Burkholderiales bacterium]
MKRLSLNGRGFGTTLSRRVFLTLLSASALMSTGQAVAAQDVKLNEVLRSLFYAPQYVALKIGAFEQEGLNIVGPKTTWGTQASITEVISGGSNIVLLGPEAAALTQDAGPDRRLVNFAKLTNSDGSFIISKTPIPNFKITDLKGKTIVTSGTGSTPYLALIHLLKKAGLDPKKDVNIRPIPVSANIIPSYLEGGAHFAQAFEPAVVKAVNETGAHRVASVGVLLGAVPYTTYMAPASFIEKNPAIIQSFTNAIYKGLIWTDTHTPEQIAEAVAPYFKDIPMTTIQTVIAEYKKAKVWTADVSINPEGMNQMVDMLVDGGVLKARVPYESIVNPKFAQKARQDVKP